MSQYRDDQVAARHRIDSLESELAERDERLAEHARVLDDKDREIARLARELRTAGTARISAVRRPSGARFVVAGAMSAAVMAGMVGYLNVRRTSAAVTGPAVTFADPPPREATTQAPSPDDRVPGEGIVERSPVPIDTDRLRTSEEQQIEALLPKMQNGTANVMELRLLKALCSHAGKVDCRSETAAMLAKKLDESRLITMRPRAARETPGYFVAVFTPRGGRGGVLRSCAG